MSHWYVWSHSTHTVEQVPEQSRAFFGDVWQQGVSQGMASAEWDCTFGTFSNRHSLQFFLASLSLSLCLSLCSIETAAF